MREPATPQVMSVFAANAPVPLDLHFIFLNKVTQHELEKTWLNIYVAVPEGVLILFLLP